MTRNILPFHSSRIIAPLVLLLALSWAGQVAAAKLYKWVDENGKVHYSDQVPPTHARHERRQLNEQGMTVEKTEAAKTAEQIAKDKEEAARQKEQQARQAQKLAEDRQLLSTYHSVDDIIQTRDSRINAIENLIQITEVTLESQNDSLTRLQRNAADYERSGRSPPGNLLTRIQQAREQVQNTERYIAEKRAEQELVRQKFEQDIARYRQLMEENES